MKLYNILPKMPKDEGYACYLEEVLTHSKIIRIL